MVDSRPGIASCVLTTLREFAYGTVPVERIERMIGPPLHLAFAELLVELGGDLLDVDACVLRYRELYAQVATTGGTLLQPGIRETLEMLAPHATLAVATSKSLRFSGPILEALGIRDFFAAVAAPDAMTDGESKADTLERAINMVAPAGRASVWMENACMIGDRSYDVVAAIASGVRPVGVTWGYGSEKELRDAGASSIVRAPKELVPLVLRPHGGG